MIFGYINEQWNSLRSTALALQENLSEALDSQCYSSKQEEQTLRDMQRATRKIIAALLGYVD